MAGRTRYESDQLEKYYDRFYYETYAFGQAYRTDNPHWQALFGGIAHAYDGIALHPYTNNAAPDATSDGFYSFSGAVTQSAALMARYGDASHSTKKLYIL